MQVIKRKLLMIMVALVASGCGAVIAPASNIADLSQADMTQDLQLGRSCVATFLGLGPFGNLSVYAAAKSGNLARIVMVEHSVESYLIARRYCVLVYGVGADSSSTPAATEPKLETPPDTPSEATPDGPPGVVPRTSSEVPGTTRGVGATQNRMGLDGPTERESVTSPGRSPETAPDGSPESPEQIPATVALETRGVQNSSDGGDAETSSTAQSHPEQTVHRGDSLASISPPEATADTLSISGSLVAPVGNFGTIAGPGVGASIRWQRPLSSELSLGARAGLLVHSGQDLGPVSSRVLQVPILGGARYYISPLRAGRVYVAGELGFNILVVSASLGETMDTGSDLEFGASMGGGWQLARTDIYAGLLFPSRRDVAFMASAGYSFHAL